MTAEGSTRDNLWNSFEVFLKQKMFPEAFECMRLMYEKRPRHDILDKFRAKIRPYCDTEEKMELLKFSYDMGGQDYFDDFLIAMEWDREHKFYLPRRKALYPLVVEMEKLAKDELDCLCISMPPGVGKSGLAIFYLCWCAGRNPYEGMLGGSHNTAFLRGVYDECVKELMSDEYRWSKIFPYRVMKTNALDLKIDVARKQRFSTFQFTSVGSGNAGKVRAVQLLYCDDLIEGIEEAMNKDRLDKKWQLYTDDLRQRKQGYCKELHIATRWSVNDIIGRLQNTYGDNPRYEFISVPALNEKGESNFDYGGSDGFTTEFYENMRQTMDDVSWRCLYMNEPIEREGILYDATTLKRYYDLPEGEPDGILAVCDTASGAGDDLVLPVFYVYGKEHYLVDCVVSNALPEVTTQLCADILNRHRVKQCQFESNAAGSIFADNVHKLTGCTITKKWSQGNKETKIIVNSAWVKENVYFRDDSTLERGSMYKTLMDKLCAYTVSGKNKHDDVPDAMAQYALFVENAVGMTATVMKRKW